MATGERAPRRWDRSARSSCRRGPAAAPQPTVSGGALRPAAVLHQLVWTGAAGGGGDVGGKGQAEQPGFGLVRGGPGGQSVGVGEVSQWAYFFFFAIFRNKSVFTIVVKPTGDLACLRG